MQQPPTLRLQVLMILKFLGRNRQSFACKLAITSSASKRSIKGYQIKFNGYTPEITTLWAIHPEYRGLHPKNKQFQLKGCHTIQMGGSYDHTYLNALEHLQLVIQNLRQIYCLRSNDIYFIWIHLTKKNIRVEYV